MVPSFLPVAAERPRTFPGLLADCLRRPGSRRVMSALTALLVVAGVGIFAYPLVTDLVQHVRQSSITQNFNNPAVQRAYAFHEVKVGDGLTLLKIKRMHVKVMVVEGVTVAALRAGAGHYPETPLPCEQGNVAIAGHRTTYGRPFNQLNIMRPGDTAVLITPFAQCTYTVVPGFGGHDNPWPVLPDNVSVISQRGALGTGHWLTLTTCNPPGSAAQRLILRLKLTGVKVLRPLPKGATIAPAPAPTPSSSSGAGLAPGSG